MPWVRLDDRFPSHRKVALLSDRAFRLHVSALCWASENLTEGKILDSELRVIAHVRGIKAAAKELEDRELWDRVDDGWVIHDFLEYNPDRVKVQKQRENNAARQQAWRDRKRAEREAKKAAEEATRNAVTRGAQNRENDTTATGTRHEDDTKTRKSGGANPSSSQVSEIRNGVSNGTPAPAPSPSTSYGSTNAAAGGPEIASWDTLADLKRAIAAAGISGVSWNFKASQIERARQVRERVGLTPMVQLAVNNVRLKGTPAGASAWLDDWETLQPNPEGVTALPTAVNSNLRAVSGGWQPFRNPTNHDVYDEDLI